MSKQNTAYDFSLFEPQQKELPRSQATLSSFLRSSSRKIDVRSENL